ncbi:MAG: hypothetical protein ACYTG5_07405 [Planctomycetota bacterium]|jgi:hypothetical protein
MDPSKPRDQEEIEGQILDSLSQIDRSLESIVDGSYAANPAELSLDLDLCGDQLSDLLGTLTGELDALADAAGCTLNEVAETVLSETVAALSHPVVVSTSWGSGLPPVSVTLKMLRATLSRIFALAAGYAGPGGELSLRTLGLVDGAALSARARPVTGASQSPQSEEVLLRCRSLDQFINDLGGRFEAELDEDGTLHFRTELAGAKKLS